MVAAQPVVVEAGAGALGWACSYARIRIDGGGRGSETPSARKGRLRLEARFGSATQGTGQGCPVLEARAGLALLQALHQLFLDGTDTGLSAGHRAHLAQYVLEVLAGGPVADAQPKGDLLVGHSACDEIEHG